MPLRCRQSLAELGTPYVDMVLLHAPGDAGSRADTWRALEDAVKQASGHRIAVRLGWAPLVVVAPGAR